MEKRNTFISVREFSKITGIGLNTCYSIVSNPSFPKIRVGNKILIVKDKVDAWINNNIGNQF